MNCQLCNQQCLDNKNNVCSKCSTSGQEYNNMEEIMTDMFGEGGKEEVKETFATTKEPEWKERLKDLEIRNHELPRHTINPMVVFEEERLMQFISTLLQSRDREIREEIDKKIIDKMEDYKYAEELDVCNDIRALLKPTK